MRNGPQDVPPPGTVQQQAVQGTGIVSSGVTQVHLENGDLGGGAVMEVELRYLLGWHRGPGPPFLGKERGSHFRHQLWPKAFSPGLLGDPVTTVGEQAAALTQKGSLAEVTRLACLA